MRRILFYLSVALLAFGFGSKWQNVSAQTVNMKARNNADYVIACSNENLLSVWDKIKNEFKKYSTKDLTKIGGNNCENLFKVKEVLDLNGDTREEIIVRRIADCPILINCTLWIFQKKKSKYQVILNVKEIERYTLKETKTNNYTDIQLRTHKAGTSHYFQSFKFSGKKYTPRKCWWEYYAVLDKKGDFYELKKPQISYVKCGGQDRIN